MKRGRHILMLLAAVAGLTVASLGTPSEATACPSGQYSCYNVLFDWELGCLSTGDECLGCCFKETQT